MVYYWVHHIIMIFDAHLFDISHHWDTADNWLIITVLRMIDIQYIHYIYVCIHTHTTLYETTCLHMHVICNKAIATVWTVVRYVDIILSCVYIYCIYIYNIYIHIQYVLCSRVQQLGLMIAGVTTSCQLHQLGRWLLQWLGDWLLGDSFSPWVSPKKTGPLGWYLVFFS